MMKPIHDHEALRRYLAEQDQADMPDEQPAPQAGSTPAPPQQYPAWALVSERETDTAIYRTYESGVTRMEVVTRKATDELLAFAYAVDLPRLVPGNAAASAAFRAGLEDEYIEGMKARFGGEW